MNDTSTRSEGPTTAEQDGSGNPAAPTPVVGIGASAGGVDALRRFFDHLSENSPSTSRRMAVVVVLHLSDDADSNLASLLQHHTNMVVEEATDGTTVRPGHAYVIPPGTRLKIEESTLHLTDTTHPHEISTIDRFFRSLAENQGENAIGIVLSGMGTDGSLGLRAIKEAGGITMVQNPAEAEFSHMPQSALRAAQVDLSLPIPAIVDKLSEYGDHAAPVPTEITALQEEGQSAFQRILGRLRSETGHDFSRYNRSSLLRRVRRRMQIHAHSSLSDYLNHLRDHPGETESLYKDLLIGVTSFFRSPAAFDALAETVIPDVCGRTGDGDQVRVWVPGCATGEEAYSIAMLFAEHTETLDHPPEVQIFATDVNEEALQFARDGLYPAPIQDDLTPERLDRFFQEAGDYYRVKYSLREQVVFAKHNLLTDPPFSNLDLISCRNLLIYLDEETETFALELLHFGLKSKGGVLFMGGSESTQSAATLFAVQDKTHSLLRAKARMPQGGYNFTMDGSGTWSGMQAKDALEESRQLIHKTNRATGDDPDAGYRQKLLSLLRRRILDREVPSILVDGRRRILARNEQAHPCLQFDNGTLPRDLDRSVSETLRPVLDEALGRAVEQQEPVQHPGVEVSFGPVTQTTTVAVYPIGPTRSSRASAKSITRGEALPFLLIRFEGARRSDSSPEGEATGADLQKELDRLHDQLLLTTRTVPDTPEEAEAANEELLSMNEELHVMNEELHTKNHELATRREELRATNEELKATNEQLREKMEEIEETNNALGTLMAATQIATLFLNDNLRIQRYTPQNTDLFDVRPADVGRPFSELARQFSDSNLLKDARTVLKTGQTLDREIRPDTDTWLLTRVRPYSQDGGDDGVVLTFVDVTEHRTLERELVSATDKVRREIGQELHDVLSSDLAALAMKTDNITQRLDAADSAQAAALQTVVESMREAAEKSRTLSHELVPVALQEEHLAAALESLCAEQEDLSDVPCVFVGNRNESLPRDPETAMQLYRIAREAIVNAWKHADPNEIRVDLRRRDDHLVLRVRDNGTGLPNNLDEVEGLGVRTMRYRANLVGASLTLGTGPGGETAVRCALPLDDARRE